MFLDTDAASKLCADSAFGRVRAWVRRNDVCVYTSDTTIVELASFRSVSRRSGIVRNLSKLLQGRRVLAPLNVQLKWGFHQFTQGAETFQPYLTRGPSTVLKALADASPLPDESLESLEEIRENQESSWASMHANGRPGFQELLESDPHNLTDHEWMEFALQSDFTLDIIAGALPSTVGIVNRDTAEAYLQWNPMARCFMAQLLLAVKRHGIDHESASSRRGPGWNDHYQAGFAGVMDCLVTDDKRFRRALEEARVLDDCSTWRTLSVPDCTAAVKNGGILESPPEYRYPDWRAQRPPTEE